MRLGEGVERGVHRVVVGAREVDDRQPRRGADDAARLGRVRRAVEAEQDFRAAIGLDAGDGDGIGDLGAGDDDDRETAAVDRPHGRPRQVCRPRFLAHRHAVRHLEVVAVERRRLVAAEEDARHRDVARRREGLGARGALDRCARSSSGRRTGWRSCRRRRRASRPSRRTRCGCARWRSVRERRG